MDKTYQLHQAPSISVLMCMYNASRTVSEAIQSVLSQTFTSFEFIIVDDGSEDESAQIVEKYTDKRIILLRNKHDYIKSLNLGLRKCKGKYIARLDADDIMMPNRLKVQYQIMERDSSISVCGSWASTFDCACGIIGTKMEGAVDNPLLALSTGNFIIHPTTIIRNHFLKKHNIHYKRYPYAEDYKLWVDVSLKNGRFFIIPEVLLQYRVTPSQVSVRHHKEQELTRLKISQEIIEKLLEREPLFYRHNVRLFYHSLLRLNEQELLQGDEVISMIYKIVRRIENGQA